MYREREDVIYIYIYICIHVYIIYGRCSGTRARSRFPRFGASRDLDARVSIARAETRMGSPVYGEVQSRPPKRTGPGRISRWKS